MKLEKLTPEQEAMIPVIRDKWINHFNRCNPINQDKAKEFVEYIYQISDLKKPQYIFVKSPLGAQLVANFFEKNGGLKQVYDSVWSSVEDSVRDSVKASVRSSVEDSVSNSVWSSVWSSVAASVWSSVEDSVRDSVKASVRSSVAASVRSSVNDFVSNSVRSSVEASVWSSVEDSVEDSVMDSVSNSVKASVRSSVEDSVSNSVLSSVYDSVSNSVRSSVEASVWSSVEDSVARSVGPPKLKWYYFTYYGSCLDYGWVSFFDFFVQIGHIKHNAFEKFSKLLFESNVYDLIVLDKLVIVVENPVQFTRGRLGRLHNPTESAIKFSDGYELYRWNGVEVKKNWILNKESITKEEIISEKNAEKRRCIREILGADKYFELLGGVNLIDEDTDDNGNLMQLFETKEIDEIINKKIQFIKVICPSTKREYMLYPNQKSKNVWYAKSSTFKYKKIAYRHGDVGLLSLSKNYERPLIET